MALKSRAFQTWARRIHIYVSMALLMIVLFFSITGITLNRPALFESNQPLIVNSTLQLPDSLFLFNDNRLVADEHALIDFLKQQGQVSGSPSAIDLYVESEDNQLVIAEASMDFKGPGYNATVFIDVLENIVEIESTDYGLIARLNDLHKGRNSGEIWKWFIDITAALMVLFVLTGVCLLLPKKRTLHTSLKWAALGSVTSLLIYVVAVP